MINRVIYAKDRAELVAATRALDRVLLWNFYVVPQWTWARCAPRAGTASAGRKTMPKYGLSAFPSIWWWDKDKAAKAPRRS